MLGLSAVVVALLIGIDTPDVEGDQNEFPDNPDVVIEDGITDSNGADSGSGYDDVSDTDDSSGDTGPAMDYQWLPACGINYPGEVPTTCP
ncbi:MAG: hypothetical protein L0K86_16450, partial [Actinomycetia bacterium]|nr:hypothetical protein [Actinomycetes bacterium]